MTIPGSMIMSSDMWALSQAMTMTAWRPGTLRQMYCEQPSLVTNTILFQGGDKSGQGPPPKFLEQLKEVHYNVASMSNV